MFVPFSPAVTEADHHIGKRRKSINFGELTKAEIKRRATDFFQQGRVTPKMQYLISMLATAGVLTTQQIRSMMDISPRTIQSYAEKGIINRLYILKNELKNAYGFHEDKSQSTASNLRLNALSPIGHEIAPLIGINTQLDKYDGFGTHRILHEVLCNEVVLRISKTAYQLEIPTIWVGKYHATVYNDKNRPSLEPDSMIVFRLPDGSTSRVLIEYHNEDSGRRAMEKVIAYEKTLREGYWKQAWKTDEFPPVLAIYTHAAVGKGYAKALEEQKRRMGVRVNYFGKSWKEIIDDNIPLNMWWSFNDRDTADVFPWMQKPEKAE